MPSHGGRPRSSSRRTIEEAAGELFLERGYAETSIEDIARRAGVSRASFFNYFAAKSDVLWVDVDELLDALEAELASAPRGLEGTVRAVARVAAGASAASVPLVLTQAEAMALGAEALASGSLRLARLAATLRRSLAGTAKGSAGAGVHTRAADHGGDDVIVADALAGALAGAWLSWARAGSRRGPLAPVVARAIALVRDGVDGARFGAEGTAV